MANRLKQWIGWNILLPLFSLFLVNGNKVQFDGRRYRKVTPVRFKFFAEKTTNKIHNSRATTQSLKTGYKIFNNPDNPDEFYLCETKAFNDTYIIVDQANGLAIKRATVAAAFIPSKRKLGIVVMTLDNWIPFRYPLDYVLVMTLRSDGTEDRYAMPFETFQSKYKEVIE